MAGTTQTIDSPEYQEDMIKRSLELNQTVRTSAKFRASIEQMSATQQSQKHAEIRDDKLK